MTGGRGVPEAGCTLVAEEILPLRFAQGFGFCAQDDRGKQLRGMRLNAAIPAFSGSEDGRVHTCMGIIGPDGCDIDTIR